jgi:hypothetical protein
MRETFIPYRPHQATRAVIEQANEIVNEYLAQGLTLTLRQLFYQFVARGLIENTHRAYKNLGETIRNARNGGLLDWGAIEDRTREVNTHPSWDSRSDCRGRFHSRRTRSADRTGIMDEGAGPRGTRPQAARRYGESRRQEAPVKRTTELRQTRAPVCKSAPISVARPPK